MAEITFKDKTNGELANAIFFQRAPKFGSNHKLHIKMFEYLSPKWVCKPLLFQIGHLQTVKSSPQLILWSSVAS